MLVLAVALALLIRAQLSYSQEYAISLHAFSLLWAIMLIMLMDILLDRNLTTIVLCPGLNVEGLKHCVARLGTSVSL